jgi:hypothetical protein
LEGGAAAALAEWSMRSSRFSAKAKVWSCETTQDLYNPGDSELEKEIPV